MFEKTGAKLTQLRFERPRTSREADNIVHVRDFAACYLQCAATSLNRVVQKDLTAAQDSDKRHCSSAWTTALLQKI